MNKIVAFLFLFSSFFKIIAQDKQQQSIQYFAENFPQEKIHVVLNKKSYAAGENMVFKSYILDGFKPSAISTTLFVELLDKDKKIIDKKMFPIFQGESFGNIKLADDLKENVYYFRAYTTWMTNFNEKFQWLKPVAIYNPKSPEKLVINKASDWYVTLHPESGNLLSEIPNKVSVRIHSSGENSKNWKGFVFEEKNPNKKIAEFQAFDQNVGLFTITPELGKNYKVTIEDSGISKTFDLPSSKNSGISLQLKNEGNTLEFFLKSNPKNASEQYKVYGQINNRLVYFAKIFGPDSQKIYKIPTEKLVNGILQLAVFDSEERLVAERLCFVDPKNLKIGVPTIQNANFDSGARKQNNFGVASSGAFTNYAVELYDDSFESSEDEYSLPSTMWLTGDLTSDISYPAQYFSENANTDALDALLISEKWERFDWKNLITGKYPQILNIPSSYIAYKADVTLGGAPAKDEALNITFKNGDKGLQVIQVKTDDKGQFIFENMIFDQPFDIFYQVNDKKKAGDAALKVFLQPLVSFVTYKSSLPKNIYKLSSEADAKQDADVKRFSEEATFSKNYNEKVYEIEEVKITASKEKLTEKLNNELSSDSFRSMNERVFDFVNDNNSPGVGNILDWLQGRIPGLQMVRDGLEVTPKIRNAEMEIYVDEGQVDAAYLSSISLSDIAMIKVISPPFFKGSGVGAIAIYLQNGRNANKNTNTANELPALKSRNLIGYDKVLPFANASYDNIKSEEISNDKRVTLYWNPYLISRKDENGFIKFYNNDVAKKVKATIIGYDEDNKKYIYFHGFLENLK